jgi:hypothetical protein
MPYRASRCSVLKRDLFRGIAEETNKASPESQAKPQFQRSCSTQTAKAKRRSREIRSVIAWLDRSVSAKRPVGKPALLFCLAFSFSYPSNVSSLAPQHLRLSFSTFQP